MRHRFFAIFEAIAAASVMLTTVLTASCGGTGNGGDDVLLQTEHYTIVADSVLEDSSLAVASRDGRSLTARYDGVTRVWRQSARPLNVNRYRSPQHIVDVVYNMSLDEVAAYINKKESRHDSRLLNLETCYYIDLALAMLDPKLSMELLQGMTRDGYIAAAEKAPMQGGHHIWAQAAWKVYLVTGDKEWLRSARDIVVKTLQAESSLLSEGHTTELMHGSAPFLSTAAYYPQWMDERDLYDTFSLDENIMLYRAYALLYEMDDVLSDTSDADPDNDNRLAAEHLKDALNAALWDESNSMYSQFSYGSIAHARSPRTDNLGQAFAVLWDAADDNRAETLIEESPVTPYGVTAIYPCVVDSFQHLGTLAMPLLQSYWNMAAARTANTNMLRRGMGAAIRAQALAASCNITVDALDGSIDIGGHYGMANACGNIAAITHIFAGLNFLPDGIELNPVVPRGYGGTKLLSNVKYRGRTFDIAITGTGSSYREIRLDGMPLDDNFITAERLTDGSRHKIDIVMNGTDADRGKVTLALHDKALPEPPEVEWRGRQAHIKNYDPEMTYRVFVDDLKPENIDDSIYRFSDTLPAARVIAFSARNKWGESFRSHPFFLLPYTLTFQARPIVTDGVKTGDMEAEIDVDEAGDYILSVTYSLPEPRAAARVVTVNTHAQAMLVMPRDKSTDPDASAAMLTSNAVKITLLKGRNAVTLVAPDVPLIPLPHYHAPFNLYTITLTKLE